MASIFKTASGWRAQVRLHGKPTRVASSVNLLSIATPPESSYHWTENQW